MAAYYNENNKYAAAWLWELIKAGLIADGEVDTRSIVDVSAGDVRGFTQCHFFAGIGGCSYALRLAGWDDGRPVWTGSCPCQPLSSAARGRLVQKDLRPEWIRLVAATRPRVVFGEQVVNERWADSLVFDLEYLGYAVGAAVLPACAVGFDHARERFYFVGDANRDGESSVPVDAEMARVSRDRSIPRSLVPSHGISRDVVAFSGFGNAIVPQVAQVFIESYQSIERTGG